MTKPIEIILADGETMPVKEVCQMFKVKYIYMDGIRYAVPEKWQEEYES